jgi:hypothetical protein
MKIVLGSLGGAVAIHVAFLACSSSSPIAKALDSGTNDARADMADASTTEGGAITVGNTLDVAHEDCSHTMTDADAGPTTYHYAAHAYPGLSAAQLSQVRAIGHIAGNGVSPLGYAWGVPRDQGNKFDGFFVTDESVAVICGVQPPNAAVDAWYDSVTFTLVK